MKTFALLLCMGLFLPVFAQEAPAPEAPKKCPTCIKERKAPTPEQREAFRKQMKEMHQKRMEAAKAACKCGDDACPCFKVMAERPKMQPPAKKPSEMTDEERAAFRAEKKAAFEAFRQKLEAAKAACKCGEACQCLPRPPMMRGKMGKKGKGPHPRKMMKGKKCCPPAQQPAPEAPVAE